jgi:hypothetical protein
MTCLKDQFTRNGFHGSEGEAGEGTSVHELKQNPFAGLFAQSMSQINSSWCKRKPIDGRSLPERLYPRMCSDRRSWWVRERERMEWTRGSGCGRSWTGNELPGRRGRRSVRMPAISHVSSSVPPSWPRGDAGIGDGFLGGWWEGGGRGKEQKGSSRFPSCRNRARNLCAEKNWAITISEGTNQPGARLCNITAAAAVAANTVLG